MSNWDFLNSHRVTRGRFATTEADGFNGAFQFNLPGEARRILCIASDGMGWKHVSASFLTSTKPPGWEVMSQIKELFWEPSDWVAQFHPARSEYVNNHPGCLHLWQSTEMPMPIPKSILVGIKELGTLKK